jgi:exodeoxyribonuclease VII small subunit
VTLGAEAGKAKGNKRAPKADESIGYEQARAELERVVRELEAGAPTLEESLALWERGEELAAICTRWLEGAEARLAAATEALDAD